MLAHFAKCLVLLCLGYVLSVSSAAARGHSGYARSYSHSSYHYRASYPHSTYHYHASHPRSTYHYHASYPRQTYHYRTSYPRSTYHYHTSHPRSTYRRKSFHQSAPWWSKYGSSANRSNREHRSAKAKRDFEAMTGHAGGWPGHVVDHIIPLACGGADAPSNMQWQTIAEGKVKDKWERNGCKTHSHHR